MTLVVVALVLALVGCALTYRDWAVARRAQIDRCAARGHARRYHSLFGEGVYWQRSCAACPAHEPIPLEEVPAHLRRAEPAVERARVLRVHRGSR